MANTNISAASANILHYSNENRYKFLFSFNSLSLLNKSLHFTKSSPPSLLSLSSSLSKYQTTRVSTAPVEYAPPSPNSFNFHQEISRLQSIRSKLANSKTVNDNHLALDDDSRVKQFFKIVGGGASGLLDSIKLDSHELFLIKCLVAAGQEHVISLEGIELFESEVVESARSSIKSALYSLVEIVESFDFSGNGNKGLEKANHGLHFNDDEIKDLKKLLKSLKEIDEFYDCIGGIIGYQIMVLELLSQSTYKKQSTNWSQSIKKSMECQFLEIHAPTGVDLSKNTEYASEAALWGIEI